MMATTQLLLRALRHPDADTVQIDAFRQLVMWLEDRKIRAYKVADRKGLSAADSPDWTTHLQKYLQELNAPTQLLSGGSEAQLLWLLRLAVAREYEDNKTRAIDVYFSAATPSKAASTPHAELPHLDVSEPEVQAQLSEMLQRISSSLGSTTPAAGSLPHRLQAARVMVTHRIAPAVAAKEQGTDVSFATAANFPTGFTTADPQVDMAAMLLRVLYTRELRQVQSLIDNTIISVQEYTADPKTDSALGKTGR